MKGQTSLGRVMVRTLVRIVETRRHARPFEDTSKGGTRNADAVYLYRIAASIVESMRERMLKSIVGDAEMEGRFASMQCERTRTGVNSLDFLFDYFDALFESSPEMRSSTQKHKADDAEEAYVDDLFFERAKAFYFANDDEKKASERYHRALGMFENEAYRACSSGDWSWLFRFFPISSSSYGTWNPTPFISLKKCAPHNCIHLRKCCDINLNGNEVCVYHESICTDYCGPLDDDKRCDLGPPHHESIIAP